MFPEITESGFGELPFGFGSQQYAAMADFCRQYGEALEKAYTTGDSVIQPLNAGGPSDSTALRVQLMDDVLEQVSYDQQDAALWNRIPKEKVYGPLLEWDVERQYGGSQSVFVGETGSDGNFGVGSADDIFARLAQKIKYLGVTREVGLVASLTRQVAKPETIAEMSATLELIGKANVALYFGSSKTEAVQFDGIIQQMLDWLSPVTTYVGYGQSQHSDILFDAQGLPIDQIILNEMSALNRVKYGAADTLLQSVQGYHDTQKLLFPYQRAEMGSTGGTFGVDKREFATPYGKVKLVDDVLLRPQRPIAVEGAGVTGDLRNTDDTGALSYGSGASTDLIDDATSPTIRTNGVVAGTPGTLDWWLVSDTKSYTLPTDNGPKLPTGGTNGNRLSAGTYYYAVSIVYDGKESKAFYYNNGNSGDGASHDAASEATGVAVTSGQAVCLVVDNTKVVGITSDIAKKVKYRVYRSTSATGTYKFLMEAPASGNTGVTRIWDNGMYMPGTDNAFLLTFTKNRRKQLYLAQMLPMMKRALPNKAMSDLFAMLLFCAPILRVPHWNIWVRNVGRANL